MPTSLPYLVSPGSITTALERIREAAVPERITGDFISTILNIKGGTGSAILPFLKKINFVASDGTPTQLYQNFRNQSIGGKAIADAIKFGYSALAEVKQSFYKLQDTELKDLIVQVTGLDAKSKVVKLTLSTLTNLKEFADFNAINNTESTSDQVHQEADANTKLKKINDKVGFNLSYTINLNLPPSSDPAVFNAIFKSLKEHLLSDE